MASSSPPDAPAVVAAGLGRHYRDGARTLEAIADLSLTVKRGEVIAVMGPSGSGKTTLLHLLGGLDDPDAGQACVAGVDWQTLRGKDRARFRRRECGFVIQGLSLLPQATAAENVEVPLLLDGIDAEDRKTRIADLLSRVDLTHDASKLPDQLSGGQQQRVAIARALVNNPAVVLADEPTGSLDSTNAVAVVQLLLEASRERGAAVVLVTHDPAVAAHADRLVVLRSGRLDPSAATPTGGD
jgi:ABC-type lipoprotein export system ATPase subunit